MLVSVQLKYILLEMDTMHVENRTEKLSMSHAQVQTGLSLTSKSPRKMKLHQRIRKYKKRIAVLESKVQEIQSCDMKNINTLDVLLEKYYPKQTADFLKMQARLFKKEVKGRRFTPAFKQHCLAIYFTSPKAYRNLVHKSKLFCLPSCSTLRKFTQHHHIDQGLQDNVIEMLKIKVNSLNDINKYCIICIDEMSLKMNLFYNITQDKIIGFDHSELLVPARNVAALMSEVSFNRGSNP